MIKILKPSDIMDFITEQLKALGDTTRLRIVGLLSHGELCICNLLEVLELPQSTVSRHTSILKKANLVTDRRNGKWIHYKLSYSDKYIKELLNLLCSEILLQEQGQKDLEKLKAYIKRKNNS